MAATGTRESAAAYLTAARLVTGLDDTARFSGESTVGVATCRPEWRSRRVSIHGIGCDHRGWQRVTQLCGRAVLALDIFLEYSCETSIEPLTSDSGDVDGLVSLSDASAFRFL